MQGGSYKLQMDATNRETFLPCNSFWKKDDPSAGSMFTRIFAGGKTQLHRKVLIRIWCCLQVVGGRVNANCAG